jgi:hypothetical protein
MGECRELLDMVSATLDEARLATVDHPEPAGGRRSFLAMPNAQPAEFVNDLKPASPLRGQSSFFRPRPKMTTPKDSLI